MATHTAQDREAPVTSEARQSSVPESPVESPRRYESPQSTSGSDSVVSKLRGFRFEFGPNRKDILTFTTQLAVMVRAGISLQDALEGIGDQCTNQKFRAVIHDLKARIEEGNSFSQALAEYPNIFSNLYINMVAAAEASGSLSDMLQKLAEYLDQEAETRSQVKGAMVYPIIIAVMAVTVTLFLLCWVLPRFTALFKGKENLLPTPTIVLMAASSFVRHWWYVIIPGIGAAIGGSGSSSIRRSGGCGGTG